MKKYLLLCAAIIAAVSLTGCGNKAADNSAATAAPDAVEDINHVFDNADDKIDMSKVEGTDATTANDDNAKGTVAGADVEITDAKVVNLDGTDMVVVSFKFKNRTGEETTFNGIERVTAVQDTNNLAPAVITDVEGISCETLAQVVPHGETITVQKAFRLFDTETPLTITVTPAAEPDSTDEISKVFNLK